MKLTINLVLKIIVFVIVMSTIFSNENNRTQKNKKAKTEKIKKTSSTSTATSTASASKKIRAKMLKRLKNDANVDEKKVLIYRILSYDSKLSIVLMKAGLIPNTTAPDTVTNTNIINQLREFMHNFNDTASLTDTRTNFDKSLDDGFKVLKEKYKFEFKNDAANPPPASK